MQRGDLLGVLAVEIAGRLVRPHDRRVVDERARDRHALALAAGELVRAGGARGAAGPTSSSASSARRRASRGATRARPAAAARRSRPPSGPASGCRTGRRSPSAARGSRSARGRTCQRAPTPSIRISPASIASRPERQFSSVVLPQPLGPMIATISPRASVEVDAAQRGNLDTAGVVGLDDAACLDDRACRHASSVEPATRACIGRDPQDGCGFVRLWDRRPHGQHPTGGDVRRRDASVAPNRPARARSRACPRPAGSPRRASRRPPRVGRPARSAHYRGRRSLPPRRRR